MLAMGTRHSRVALPYRRARECVPRGVLGLRQRWCKCLRSYCAAWSGAVSTVGGTAPAEWTDTEMVVGPTAHGELLSVVNNAGLVLDGIVFSPPRCALGNRACARQSRELLPAVVHTSVRESPGTAWSRLAFLQSHCSHDGVSEGLHPRLKRCDTSVDRFLRFETCLEDLDALLRFRRLDLPDRWCFRATASGVIACCSTRSSDLRASSPHTFVTL